jgi:hypothetical protein
MPRHTECSKWTSDEVLPAMHLSDTRVLSRSLGILSGVLESAPMGNGPCALRRDD